MKKALLGPNFIEFRSALVGIQTPNLLIRSQLVSADNQNISVSIFIFRSFLVLYL